MSLHMGVCCPIAIGEDEPRHRHRRHHKTPANASVKPGTPRNTLTRFFFTVCLVHVARYSFRVVKF